MNKQRIILLFLPLVAFLLTAFLVLNEAQAGTEHNIRGLASSSQGYISFNCLDDDFFGRFPMIFPFYFNVAPCSVSQHGVHLDDDNNFSGEAWSPSLGYIHFDSSSTPPALDYSFNANCSNTCDVTNDCIACYNENDQRVYGWAYQNSTGDWISLNSESPPVAMTNYAANPAGIFSGYASSSFGQISFNCFTDNTCGINDYKVYMWKLELQEMSAPNWSFAQACSGGARQAVFAWKRKSGTQSAYQVIINTANNTSSPVFDSGKLSGTASQLICPGPYCAWTPAYDTTYYWWLQLWDQDNKETELFQFNINTYGVLTDNIDHNTASSTHPDLTFTTYKHEFPQPLFLIPPPPILVGTTTDFISDAYYHDAANVLQPCTETDCDYLWMVSNPATAIIDDATAHSTGIFFVDNTPQVVTLGLSGPNDHYCSMSSPVLTINFQLPIWREVKAQ